LASTALKLKIGTRKSELARWQANRVAGRLEKNGYDTELVLISSLGDQDQDTPLYKMGGKGVFTKALDDALLKKEIDLAVHSFKDLPTEQPLPLKVAAVLKREDARDALVAPGGLNFLTENSTDTDIVVATGSTRRKAQWLARYPDHKIVNIRGNVNTRLEKVEKHGWNGAIFAAAGLKRIGLDHHISEYLDWMIPAPAQGALAVMVREQDRKIFNIVHALNHEVTERCTTIERDLLHDLEAGCSAPVGAFAYRKGKKMLLKAIALQPDGSESFEYSTEVPWNKAVELGHQVADILLEKGADSVIKSFKS